MATIEITTQSGAVGNGDLQLQNGAPMDATLRFVTDALNTASPLMLSTGSVTARGLGNTLTNVAFGDEVLDANTTAVDNTAFGYRALTTATTGGGNTGIGSNALRLNSTGTGNTALGYLAMENNTNSNNTALGYRSLRANTSGTYNVGVGVDALLVIQRVLITLQ
jgi:trimeric autotransporter adhesin